MLDQCVQRCVHRRKLSYKTVMLTMDCAINRLCESFEMGRRNPSTMLSNLEKEPGQEDIAMLHKCFEKETVW